MKLSPPVRAQWLLVTLCGLLALAVAGCGGGNGGATRLEDAALSARDVPDGWVPVDLAEERGQALWETLPDLLTANSETRLILRAFEAESGLYGAATMLIETEEERALPESIDNQDTLASLSRLLVRQDALLIPDAIGGDPGTYLTATDLPVPGSIHSRLVRALDDGFLYSDSVTFTVGPVLAVVTVWYPENGHPFGNVEEIAADVEQRLHAFLNAS